MNIEQARFNMIEQQIRPWDVLDSSVLKLLSVVKRELFVPASFQSLAFVDIEIPLHAPSDKALEMGQCMLAPRVEARLLQDLALAAHEKVLEIGTGSGYMAALLAHCCQRVISLEIDSDLADMAKLNLKQAGISNVEVRLADGNRGSAMQAPFDAILLSGSVAEVPHQLLEQLKVGGRLMAIVGAPPMMCATLITRTGESHFRTLKAWDTLAPRLLNFQEHSRFVF